MIFDNGAGFTELTDSELRIQANVILSDIIKDFFFYRITEILNEDYHLTKLVFTPINKYLRRQRIAFVGMRAERWSDTQEIYCYTLLLKSVSDDDAPSMHVMLPTEWINDIFIVDDMEIFRPALHNIYCVMLQRAQEYIIDEGL